VVSCYESKEPRRPLTANREGNVTLSTLGRFKGPRSARSSQRADGQVDRLGRGGEDSLGPRTGTSRGAPGGWENCVPTNPTTVPAVSVDSASAAGAGVETAAEIQRFGRSGAL